MLRQFLPEVVARSLAKCQPKYHYVYLVFSLLPARKKQVAGKISILFKRHTPGLIGIEFTDIGETYLKARMPVR